MPLSVNDELRRAFELASLRKEAKSIETPQQWRRVNVLKTRCERLRTRESELYRSRYLARVEQARLKLIDLAGKRDVVPKPTQFEGTDRFSPEATLRQAQRDVRLAHASRLQRIDDYERRALRDLVERSRRENAVRGVALEAFTRASDRRSGVERRQSFRRDH